MFTIPFNDLIQSSNEIEYIPKTTLEKIVLSNRDINWNLVKLMKNPNITRGFILKYFDPDTYLAYLLVNPNIRLSDFNYNCQEIVEKCFNKPLYLGLIPIITEKLLNEINTENYDNLLKEIINYTSSYGFNITDRLNRNTFTNTNWSPEKHSQVIKIISKHPRTNINLINKYINYLNIFSLSQNPNLNLKFIQKYRSNIDWFYLSKNTSLSINIFKEFPELDKHILNLINNKGFNEKWVRFIFSKIDNNNKRVYDNIRTQISKHKNILIDFIDTNLDIHWCWMGISNNPNLTIDFIVKHQNKPFCPRSLSRNKCISMNDYLKYKHLDKLWNHDVVITNPNISEILIEHLDNQKKFNIACNNVFLDVNLVIKHKNKPWDYRAILSKHTLNLNQLRYLLEKTPNNGNWWFSVSKNLKTNLDNLTNDDFKKYHWDWDGLCINPNMSVNLINKYKNELDKGKYDLLCHNYFSLEKNYQGPLEYNDQNQIKSIKLINLIKEELMIKTWNPLRIEDWCLDLTEKNEI